MAYAHKSRKQFGLGGSGGSKLTPPERLQRKLDAAWKTFHITMSEFRRGKASKEDAERALRRLRRLQRKVGAPMAMTDFELLGWEPGHHGAR